MQNEGVIQELRNRKHHVKPSEKRAKQKAAGRARWLKKKRELDNR
jgi:ribosomal protein S21